MVCTGHDSMRAISSELPEIENQIIKPVQYKWKKIILQVCLYVFGISTAMHGYVNSQHDKIRLCYLLVYAIDYSEK